MTPAVPAAHLGTAMAPQGRWKSIIVVMSKGKDTFGNICLHFNGLFGSHDGFLFSLSILALLECWVGCPLWVGVDSVDRVSVVVLSLAMP